jgi:2-dehydro-3-deoxyphosphogalactonate aldolase
MSHAAFEAHLAELPLIAILRGLPPADALPVGAALVEAGFRLLEVPLNSPKPYASIELLARRLAGTATIGAGTITRSHELRPLVEAGGTLAVMPHGDPALVAAAVAAGLATLPGVTTPTEALAALDAGAHGLKLFPAELLTPPVVKAMTAVLPAGTRLFPVGGIRPETMAAWRAVGVTGFGLGSALYRPGDPPQQVAAAARAFVAAWRAG